MKGNISSLLSQYYCVFTVTNPVKTSKPYAVFANGGAAMLFVNENSFIGNIIITLAEWENLYEGE